MVKTNANADTDSLAKPNVEAKENTKAQLADEVVKVEAKDEAEGKVDLQNEATAETTSHNDEAHADAAVKAEIDTDMGADAESADEAEMVALETNVIHTTPAIKPSQAELQIKPTSIAPTASTVNQVVNHEQAEPDAQAIQHMVANKVNGVNRVNGANDVNGVNEANVSKDTPVVTEEHLESEVIDDKAQDTHTQAQTEDEGKYDLDVKQDKNEIPVLEQANAVANPQSDAEPQLHDGQGQSQSQTLTQSQAQAPVYVQNDENNHGRTEIRSALKALLSQNGMGYHQSPDFAKSHSTEQSTQAESALVAHQNQPVSWLNQLPFQSQELSTLHEPAKSVAPLTAPEAATMTKANDVSHAANETDTVNTANAVDLANVADTPNAGADTESVAALENEHDEIQGKPQKDAKDNGGAQTQPQAVAARDKTKDIKPVRLEQPLSDLGQKARNFLSSLHFKLQNHVLGQESTDSEHSAQAKNNTLSATQSSNEAAPPDNTQVSADASAQQPASLARKSNEVTPKASAKPSQPQSEKTVKPTKTKVKKTLEPAQTAEVAKLVEAAKSVKPAQPAVQVEDADAVAKVESVGSVGDAAALEDVKPEKDATHSAPDEKGQNAQATSSQAAEDASKLTHNNQHQLEPVNSSTRLEDKKPERTKSEDEIAAQQEAELSSMFENLSDDKLSAEHIIPQLAVDLRDLAWALSDEPEDEQYDKLAKPEESKELAANLEENSPQPTDNTVEPDKSVQSKEQAAVAVMPQAQSFKVAQPNTKIKAQDESQPAQRANNAQRSQNSQGQKQSNKSNISASSSSLNSAPAKTRAKTKSQATAQAKQDKALPAQKVEQKAENESEQNVAGPEHESQAQVAASKSGRKGALSPAQTQSSANSQTKAQAKAQERGPIKAQSQILDATQPQSQAVAADAATKLSAPDDATSSSSSSSSLAALHQANNKDDGELQKTEPEIEGLQAKRTDVDIGTAHKQSQLALDSYGQSRKNSESDSMLEDDPLADLKRAAARAKDEKSRQHGTSAQSDSDKTQAATQGVSYNQEPDEQLAALKKAVATAKAQAAAEAQSKQVQNPDDPITALKQALSDPKGTSPESRKAVQAAVDAKREEQKAKDEQSQDDPFAALKHVLSESKEDFDKSRNAALKQAMSNIGLPDMDLEHRQDAAKINLHTTAAQNLSHTYGAYAKQFKREQEQQLQAQHQAQQQSHLQQKQPLSQSPQIVAQTNAVANTNTNDPTASELWNLGQGFVQGNALEAGEVKAALKDELSRLNNGAYLNGGFGDLNDSNSLEEQAQKDNALSNEEYEATRMQVLTKIMQNSRHEGLTPSFKQEIAAKVMSQAPTQRVQFASDQDPTQTPANRHGATADKMNHVSGAGNVGLNTSGNTSGRSGLGKVGAGKASALDQGVGTAPASNNQAGNGSLRPGGFTVEEMAAAIDENTRKRAAFKAEQERLAQQQSAPAPLPYGANKQIFGEEIDEEGLTFEEMVDQRFRSTLDRVKRTYHFPEEVASDFEQFQNKGNRYRIFHHMNVNLAKHANAMKFGEVVHQKPSKFVMNSNGTIRRATDADREKEREAQAHALWTAPNIKP